ncbi:hypothetical protein TWF106_010714 [Orbilia oligospora]|uniref:Uncharacterized protein n=1 Tax=Orbilia oligospora TaxID=2813651 RepID=A0A7C8QF32_ORBOL|nr:hypothetical protein TWF106_010714 [Orbilia oligospora]
MFWLLLALKSNISDQYLSYCKRNVQPIAETTPPICASTPPVIEDSMKVVYKGRISGHFDIPKVALQFMLASHGFAEVPYRIMLSGDYTAVLEIGQHERCEDLKRWFSEVNDRIQYHGCLEWSGFGSRRWSRMEIIWLAMD